MSYDGFKTVILKLKLQFMTINKVKIMQVNALIHPNNSIS